MKSPEKWLRIGLVLGSLVMTAMAALAQTGSAVKSTPIDLAEAAGQSKAAGTLGNFRPKHQRFQKNQHNLPVDRTAQAAPRTAMVTAQSIDAVEPQTLSDPSPPPSFSFPALADNGQVAPPDTFGAVGPTHLVVACASQMRISDRVGNPISTISQEQFWVGVGTNIFDTRVVYDPYGQRFIMTAAADPGGPSPRLCIAVSSNSNPTLTWYRWSERVDAVNPVYADSPTLGFNKTWIVVQANMYNKSTSQFFRSEVYAYNKANLYANGTGQRTKLFFDATLGDSQVPATMYDSTNAVVYFVENWNGRVDVFGDGTLFSGYLRLFSLSGGIGSERLNLTNSFGEPIFVEVQGSTWAETATNDLDILPQLDSTNKIYAGDSRIQNVHFRDGLLYAAQTVFLPSTAPTRAAVQWWAITAGSGDIRHFGRVQDTGGTNMFAYPAIAANRYHDVVLGYSRFSSNEYPSVAYSFRQETDATDELRGQVLLKAGEASYYVPVFGQNRWGDWSATTVDPVNDVDLWTIQEYAAPRSQAGGSRWGTWWGRVSPPVDLAATMTGTPDRVPAGAQITYSITISNKQDEILSGLRLQDILPPSVSFVSATPSKGSCGVTNGVVSCSFGPVVEFEAVRVSMTVNAITPGFATNSILAYANGPDFDTSDNTPVVVTEIVNSADLQVLGSDSPDPVTLGNSLTYSITVSNRGPAAAAGVIVTSTVPAALTIGTITASQGIWDINGNVITFTMGSINLRATASISISCTANSAGPITNQVRVTANSFDSAPANNTVNIAGSVNAPPVINPVDPQTINEDVPTAIPVTVSDAETPAANLVLTATSSNPALIPSANIVPGGSGQNRTLTITSAANQFGSNTTTIIMTLTDGGGASTTSSFPINVAAVNDAPTISNIPNPPAIDEDAFTTVNFTIGDIDSPISSLILSANSSNPTLLPVANITFSPSGSSRTATLVPATNRFGTVTVTIIVSDGSLSSSDSFVLTVNPVNDPPTISSIEPQTTAEDTPTPTIAFTVNDPETPATNLTVTASSSDITIVPNANIGLANLGTNRTVRVTPAANQNGLVTITVRVSDGTNSQSTSFDLTITPVNDRPTLAQPATVTTSEDAGVISVPLTGISSGATNESQTLTVRASTSTPDLVENLQVNYTSANPTGTLTFNLVTNANGTAFIDITVSDGVVADDFTRQLQIIINAINDPPTIDEIADINVPEDSGPRSITLTGIATGPPNEASQILTITASSGAPGIVPDPQIGYTPGATTATLTFTPVANANGSAMITVTLNDGRPLNPTTTRTFQITVDSVNDMPTISAIADRRINEDTSTGLIAFSFRDVEPGPLTVAAFSLNQSLVPDANLVISPATGTNRNLTITPSPNEFGTAVITVRVSDGDGGSTNTTFLLTVDPVNDPPTLAIIPNPTAIDEDAGPQTINLSGIAPGPSNEATQQVRITATSGNPAIVPDPTVNYTFPSTTGSLTYVPAANATGSVVITVTVDDGQASNNRTTRTFTVQINSVNDLPTITGDFDDKFADEDMPISVTFTIGDVETPAGSLTLIGSSSNPELVDDSDIVFSGTGANRTVTVRPLTNEVGTAFITISVIDANGGETDAGFVLFVNEVNDPPMISTIAPQTISEDTSTATLSFWMDDVDNAVADLSVTARSSNQQIVPDANIVLGGSGTNRNVRVTPAPDANGSVTIFLTASDGNSNRISQFTLTINPVNDPPILGNIPTQNIPEDAGLQELTLTVGPGAGNETNDVLTVTAISSLPSLIPNPIGTNVSGVWKLRFTPAANASGSAIITVTVNDGRSQNATNSKSFTVNVQPMNDLPTLNPIANVNINEDAPQQNITLSGITAGGAESQTLTVNATSSNPNLINPAVSYTNGNSTAVLRFIVPGNSTGSASITVQVSDGVDTTNQTFLVTINPVNEAPVFLTTIGNLTTPEDTPISAQFTVADEETYAARLTLTATSSVTTVVANTNIVFDGSDANRWITISPVTNASGTTRITVIATDGTNSSTMSFNLTVNAVNDPPMLNPLPNLALTQNPANQTITLTGITSGPSNESGQTNSIRVTSSNTSLVPAPTSVSYASPSLTGSFILNPDNNSTGSAVITVTVSDNGTPINSFSQTSTIYIRPSGNSLPTLTGLSNRTTLEDTPITIPFTIGDATTAATNLIVGATSSNPDLAPTNAIAFGGTDANRSITITPLPNRTGSSSITVWVLDTEYGYTASNFVLQVTAANDNPVISSIPPQTIDARTNLPPVAFTVSDVETPAQNLTVAATSSNQGLLPNSSIIVGGAGTNRSIMAYPVPGQSGSATITVTVTDGNAASASTAFLLIVRAPEPPTLAIRRADPNVELRWPADAGVFTIQGRDQINTGNWSDINATPIVSGTNYVVPQPIAGPYKFFRLRF